MLPETWVRNYEERHQFRFRIRTDPILSKNSRRQTQIIFKGNNDQQHVQRLFPTQVGYSEAYMSEEDCDHVPILSFNAEGNPDYMFKDLTDHCYFDICHHTECLEEAVWIEP